jgi:hypothetical protein
MTMRDDNVVEAFVSGIRLRAILADIDEPYEFLKEFKELLEDLYEDLGLNGEHHITDSIEFAEAYLESKGRFKVAEEEVEEEVEEDWGDIEEEIEKEMTLGFSRNRNLKILEKVAKEARYISDKLNVDFLSLDIFWEDIVEYRMTFKVGSADLAMIVDYEVIDHWGGYQVSLEDTEIGSERCGTLDEALRDYIAGLRKYCEAFEIVSKAFIG